MDEGLLYALGQRLCVGFEGTRVPEQVRDLVRRYKIGSMILFARNIESYAQLRALTDEIRELVTRETGTPPLIMLDEECGTISRLKHIAFETPCAMAVGHTGDAENAYRLARCIGRQLRACGVNMNLAPVLDVCSNPDNLSSGNRCFSSDPSEAAAFGIRYARGIRDAGVLPCGKHFPGHGDTAVDSHLALPVVEKDERAVWDTELLPFRKAVEDGIGAVMSAHVVFPAMEKERKPATVSRRMMTEILRERLGFGGLSVSDGMGMKAVLDLYGLENGVLMALDAGIDIALICSAPESVPGVMDRLLEAAESGALSARNIRESLRRIEAVKAALPGPEGDERDLCPPDAVRYARELMQKAVSFAHKPGPVPKITADTLFFGPGARANGFVNEDMPFNAAKACAEAFGAKYLGPLPDASADTAVVILGRHPDAPSAVEQANRMTEGGTNVIAVSMYTPRVLLPRL